MKYDTIKIPKNKSQITIKCQILNSKIDTERISKFRALEFEIYLEFGIWLLEFFKIGELNAIKKRYARFIKK